MLKTHHVFRGNIITQVRGNIGRKNYIYPNKENCFAQNKLYESVFFLILPSFDKLSTSTTLPNTAPGGRTVEISVIFK